MTENEMSVEALPSFLITAFHTNKVRVKQMEGSVFIEPIAVDLDKKQYSCPFLGTAKGGSLTVDRFIDLKQADKELELANEKRLHS